MCSTYADAAKVFCQSAPFPEWEKRWHFKIREILGIQASYYAAFSGPIWRLCTTPAFEATIRHLKVYRILITFNLPDPRLSEGRGNLNLKTHWTFNSILKTVHHAGSDYVLSFAFYVNFNHWISIHFQAIQIDENLVAFKDNTEIKDLHIVIFKAAMA